MTNPPSWRRLIDDPEAAAAAFPGLAGLLRGRTERRDVLRLLVAGAALGGLAGCGDPGAGDGHLVPAVIAPPGIVPGIPNVYATAAVVDGSAIGIRVVHEMGRPIRIDGNPHHPSSLGATDAITQATLLDFYDQDRAVGIQRNGVPSDRPALLAMLAELRARLAETQGAGFRVLTGTVASPSRGAALDAVLARYKQARWHQWTPVSRDAVRQGAMLAYGRAVDVIPDLTKADHVLALDSDLLSGAPGHLRFARDFASRRNPTRGPMSRVRAVEPMPSLIGSAADHRVIAGPDALHAGIAALAAAVLHNTAPSEAPGWVAAALADLRGNPGRAFLHLGPDHPAALHALVHAINEALGGRGATYTLIASPEHRPIDQAASLAALIGDMQEGHVETLLVLDANPVFSAPGFAQAMRHVARTITLAPSFDETGAASSWFVPQTHDLESWGDARGHDGTASILQPQALPLYDGIDPLVLLGLLHQPAPQSAMAAVREQWRGRLADDDAWRDALAAGAVPESAQPAASVTLQSVSLPVLPPAAPLTVLFRPDPSLWDGRFANNPWLQELPRPFTKTGWDNPLLVPPGLARREKLANGDRVMLSIGARTLALPVWIMPGQAEDAVVAQFGNGRRIVGDVGADAGFDVFPLRDATGEVKLRRIAGHVAIACTDHRNPEEGNSTDILRHATLAAFTANPAMFAKKPANDLLYRRRPPGAVAWGMSIDLNSCIGCNACVVACQAENNVPVVGKANVLREREMYWLRIDRYLDGPEKQDAHFQPVLCMHCEQAPCESVCPVGATMHDQEGINVMVYNRCVGTRFCSNNCPYKVRRFNYSAFAKQETRPPIARNPDVSVRGRGVMEKCNFCLQRVAAARIAADRDGTPERVTTACQAACPTQAFTFGDLNDAASDVAVRKKSPLDYTLLAEEATFPRVTYEARIANTTSGNTG